MFARGVFFLPVIIASGVVMNLIANTNVSLGGSMMSTGSALFQGVKFESLLVDMGLPLDVVSQIMLVINGIFKLVWRSGVQVLLVLAGLQAIPKTLYEAADVEGATAWEVFWKITFPVLSPTTILVAFYTIVDYGNDTSNWVVVEIRDAAKRAKYDISATMSVVWFLVVIAIASLVLFLTRKKVYYMDDRG
jgi:ABC-type sugar transport system permease subunit